MFRSEITVRRGPPVSSRSPRVCAPPQRSPLRDMELYRLVAPLSQRPLTARMEAGPAGAFWVALWNLAGLTCDKASNLGVLEVVCRTALENGSVPPLAGLLWECLPGFSASLGNHQLLGCCLYRGI